MGPVYTHQIGDVLADEPSGLVHDGYLQLRPYRYFAYLRPFNDFIVGEHGPPTSMRGDCSMRYTMGVGELHLKDVT